MIFRGLFDLARLLLMIAISIIGECFAALVHLFGAPGVAIIVLAALWWFGWLPTIAAAIFG